MSANPTPGNWRAWPTHNAGRIPYVWSDARGGRVCMMSGDTDEDYANAILIASVLDLRNALTDLEAEISLRFTGNYEKAPEFMTEELQRKVLAARAALSKARGENTQ